MLQLIMFHVEYCELGHEVLLQQMFKAKHDALSMVTATSSLRLHSHNTKHVTYFMLYAISVFNIPPPQNNNSKIHHKLAVLLLSFKFTDKASNLVWFIINSEIIKSYPFGTAQKRKWLMQDRKNREKMEIKYIHPSVQALTSVAPIRH